ncbi:uncharacterized protein LOC105432296 [Pogonomyrmex barbatus]|uniref:Uncharacterized protein LOC105432296 n=1 Tax=Pogonomyrmex barbatus TaxID=144034 RepID=A0A6I9WP09_9HYME|nr:uncharacterized protein LOC105432296 [Pogonomyrmex barbatus]
MPAYRRDTSRHGSGGANTTMTRARSPRVRQPTGCTCGVCERPPLRLSWSCSRTRATDVVAATPIGHDHRGGRGTTASDWLATGDTGVAKLERRQTWPWNGCGVAFACERRFRRCYYCFCRRCCRWLAAVVTGNKLVVLLLPPPPPPPRPSPSPSPSPPSTPPPPS